ncbi:MAG: hypothetical protein PHF29_03855 [Candidatus Riflebacteria bacterium]|nr:hypothetical protein [Candidatus Riflebacteria bacterium]
MSSDYERRPLTEEELFLERKSEIKRKVTFFVVCLVGMLVGKYVFGF